MISSSSLSYMLQHIPSWRKQSLLFSSYSGKQSKQVRKNLSIESINTYNSVENTLKQIQSLTNQTAISFLYFVFAPSFPRSKAACFFFFYSFKVISAKRFFFSGEVEEIPFAVKHHLSPDKNNNNF